ncbi:hypothetical protein C8F04DRAFT_1173204 [Mycena alexandri]|uniref:Uncharacterized protein n=1 Tax=Mycena alexandri TaxID=1745969 RepID=A0AAD6XBH1_9AGAR|nr:hypothetical protein C8F04DRAFT_1173204 [Mycena alexandri]
MGKALAQANGVWWWEKRREFYDGRYWTKVPWTSMLMRRDHSGHWMAIHAGACFGHADNFLGKKAPSPSCRVPRMLPVPLPKEFEGFPAIHQTLVTNNATAGASFWVLHAEFANLAFDFFRSENDFLPMS